MTVKPTTARRRRRLWWYPIGIGLAVACAVVCWPRATGLVRYLVPAGYQGYLAIHVDDAYDTDLPTVDGITVVRWDSTGLLRMRSADPLHALHADEVMDSKGDAVTSFVRGPSERSSQFSGQVHWYYLGASPEDAAWFLSEPHQRKLGWLREHRVQEPTARR